MLLDHEEKDLVHTALDDDYVYPAFLLIYYGFVDLIPMAGQYVAVRIMPRPHKRKKLNMSNQDVTYLASTSEDALGPIPDHDESIIRNENSEDTLNWLQRTNSPEDEGSSIK